MLTPFGSGNMLSLSARGHQSSEADAQQCHGCGLRNRRNDGIVAEKVNACLQRDGGVQGIREAENVIGHAEIGRLRTEYAIHACI